MEHTFSSINEYWNKYSQYIKHITLEDVNSK